MHPDERKSSHTRQYIVRIARCLPIDIREDDLMDEWKLLQLENDEKVSKEQRIDIFWETLTLSLSHGNVDIGRLFSVSGKVLTDERASMSERTLNAVLTVKEVLVQYKNNPEYVPIMKNLISMSRTAHRKKIKVKQAKAEQELHKERKTIELKPKRREEERKCKAEVEVAQTMLQGVSRVRKKGNQQKVLADNLQRNLEKKESALLADNIL
ncbi:hypothetical protein PR048_003692 [Dryococelus australis]|uniref:Uncharacterized protein n=1 Tax=Dryococelus australis TaxID=614101 RepID=A0ABQ9INT2_9NEOP|nr:hypothetical protein PR048_003692 [Dryococelus australis]